MKQKKTALFQSVIALILCISMLMGTTFAWFTDSVTTGINTIAAGVLDVELYHSNAAVGDERVDTNTKLFMDLNGNSILWEPGVVSYENLRITNAGDLALAYQLALNTDNENFVVEESGAQYGLSQILKVGFVEGGITATDRAGVVASVEEGNWTTLASFVRSGALLPEGEGESEKTWGVVIYWEPGENDNYWNLNNGKQLNEGDVLMIDLGVKLIATQEGYESDAFGSDYDAEAKLAVFPVFVAPGSTTTTVVPNDQNQVASGLEMTAGQVSASIPAGVQLATGTTELTMSVSEMDQSDANISLGVNEAMRSLDVHIEGVAKDNTVPMTITLKEIAPVGLNMGNYKLYHVENGQTNEMTLVEEFTAHNQFKYNPATGDVTLYMATFSEVALVADTENAWNGEFDYTWYTNAVAVADSEAVTEYRIANADQLAGFGAIVGGMDGQTQNSFKGKTVKLIADINLGDKESENNPDLIFYPIGYYNSEGTYERTNTAITSGLRNFEGTFDGNGHTISNFYHNTWEMKGDHDWYSPEEQYYRDGMGLFGRIYGGTVKNLTIKNFSSDGEIATTGCVAAYADGATFENIAIFGCNPRVYNIGNGGIVGCVGWYAKEANLKTTFKNITVDNSNKISALWGSYDVACGGLVGQYYPTSGQSSANYPVNAGIHMENCHVAAQMDVYNDVCGNYQYYAYRYAGMMIGSIRENTKTEDGKYVIPDMTGITATGCTVNYGDWNDYYYCEFEKNGHPSYSGPNDYKFSRVPDSELKFTDSNHNGKVDADERASVTGCTHDHTDAENNHAIYLPFHQLFTGYGWGVNSIGLEKYSGIKVQDFDLDIEEGTQEESVEKFTIVPDLNAQVISGEGAKVTIGQLFKAVDGASINGSAVQVAVTGLNNSGITATYAADTNNWENGTLTFNKTEGLCAVTIQDYNFCKPTTIILKDGMRVELEKFAIVFPNVDKYLYRVGNQNAVALSSLFKEADIAPDDGKVKVEVKTVAGNASGKYTANPTTWENGTLKFSGTGTVTVTISENDDFAVTLNLEVVEAKNYPSPDGANLDATANNVVLLNNIGSGFAVSGDYTFYGNGFTLNYTGNGQYLNNGLKQGIVMVQNGGTLDNLHIKASIYPSAYLYYGKTTLGEYVQGGPSSVEGDKTRYHYQLSAVATYGEATISNCYIYGGRNNVYVNTGDVTIEDTVLECGTVANLQIQSTSQYTVTLNNITTIQHQTSPTIGDTSKVMLGAGVIVGPDTETNPHIILNGNFKQYNWVTADDAAAVSAQTTQMIVNGALDAKDFNHSINGKTASNLGIIYMNTSEFVVSNKTGLPYAEGTVTLSASGASVEGQVYSLKQASADHIYSDYEEADRNTINGDYIPAFEFDLGNQEISYDGSDDTRYLYSDANGVTALYQDGDAPLTLDLSKLATIYKYVGQNYEYTAVCKDSSGNALTATNNVVTLSVQDEYTLEFTVEDNIFYDENGNQIEKLVTRTFVVPLTLTVKEANVKNAEVSITKTALDGVYTTVNVTDYKLRINFLDCISVTDYDKTGTGKKVDLTANISSATLTPASVNVFTTASTITITYTEGQVLTVNLSKISGSSPGTKTATVNTSGGVYFITDGALNNKPTEAASQNKCTITSVSYKGNNGSTVTNDTDVTVTWELGSNSSGGGQCLAEGTLITLTDGSKRPIENLHKGDMVMSYDHVSGEITSREVIIVVKTAEDNYYKNTFIFDDGTELVTINEHGIFDLDLNKYVNIDHLNYGEFIGHSFVSVDAQGKIGSKKLVDVKTVRESGYKYDIVTDQTLNYVAEDTLSVTHVLVDVINSFDFGENLKYDAAKMQADIQKYGLYDYAEWAEYCDISVFEQYNIPVMKVGISKGLYTKAYIIGLINKYVLDESVQITN